MAAIAGVLVTAGAFVAVFVAPAGFQWMPSIAAMGPDGGGVNHVVVPVGYWLIVAAYAAVAVAIAGEKASTVVPRAIAVGVVVHLSMALAAFAPELASRARFSTTAYWLYSRAFLAAALAAVTAWMITRAIRPTRETAGRVDIAIVPIALGAAALLVMMIRYDTLAAIAGFVAGGAIAAWIVATSPRGGPLAALPARVRALVTDERTFLLLVFLAALALRLLFLRRIMTNPAQPDYIETGLDGRTYDRLAWSLAQGHGIPDEFRVKYPLILLGYVRWLAAIYLTAGHTYVAVCGTQAALGALTCVLIYRIAEPLAGIAVARVTAVLAAVNYQLIFAAAAIGHQGLDLFLTALTIWLLMGFARSARPGWAAAIGIGVLGGFAITVRETSAFFWAFVLLWIPFALADRLGRARAFTIAAAMTAGMLVVLAPVLAPLVATPEHRMGLREHLDRLFYDQDVNSRNDLVAPFADPKGAAQQLRAQPAFVVDKLAGSMAHNFAVQFLTQPYGGFDVVFLATDTPYYYALWFYVYAFGFVGLLAAARRAFDDREVQAAGLALVVGVLVARTVPHLLLESHYRHRAPVEPFLILIAVAGAARLCAASTRRGAEQGSDPA